MAWFAAAQDMVTTATAVVSGANDWFNFFQLVRPANISEQNQAAQFEEELVRLKISLPRVLDLIDSAEWWTHNEAVEELLSHLKDLVYDAEDLVDEVDYCELKRKLGRGVPSCSDSMKNVTCGSTSKVNEIQKRLDYLVCQMKEMALQKELRCSDHQSFRLETTSFLEESKSFYRQDAAARVIQLLGMPVKRKRNGNVSTMRESTTSHAKERNKNVSCLPIVGIGGVGKTTLVQQVCNDPRVKRYFGVPIWIFVSHQFDEKKIAREFLRSATGEKMEVSDSTDLLQRKIRDVVQKKRFLLVLDDMWDDVCSNEGEKWQVLLRALIHGLQGSTILVTTRSHKVAGLVATTQHFQLDGLPEATFWEFFKFCTFGSATSEINPELELIGRSIVSKLNGSPLAAKTLGRLLSLRRDVEYWSRIFQYELWELPQKENDILPTLRLSYQHLPSHLKRCFLVCSLFPKDHMFEEKTLIDIWTASGLLQSQEFLRSREIGHGYLQDLISQSFFKSDSGCSKYMIHSLMHDMAQLISRKEYSMIKDVSDLEKLPENIRHLSILSCGNIDHTSLVSLSRYRKLRSILCFGDFKSKDFTPILRHWFKELKFIRFLSFDGKLQEIPDSIDNLKLLAYLGISSASTFKALPSSFCSLYNLQILDVPNTELACLPEGFTNLVNLKGLKSKSLQLCEDSARFDAAKGHNQGIRLLTNIDQIHGSLKIENLEKLKSKSGTAKVLSNKKHLEKLTLNWKHSGQADRRQHGGSQTQVYGALPQPINLKFRRHRKKNYGNEMVEMEVIEGLSPHSNLKVLEILYYGGQYMPTWLHPEKLPNLRSLKFHYCDRVRSIQLSRGSLITGLFVPNGLVSGRLCTRYLFLTSISLNGCTNLSSIEEFMHPDYLPALKVLSVVSCPNINWQNILGLPCSLEKLTLDNFGKFSEYVVSSLLKISSLTYLHLSCLHLISIPLHVWSNNLKALEKLKVHGCTSLASIGVPEASFNPSRSSGIIGAFVTLSELDIFFCQELTDLDELLVPDCLPSIKTIKIQNCAKLVSLPVERFGGFVLLENLEIFSCPGLGGQGGRQLSLPSSVQRLHLAACGDISGWIPSCLQSLSSLTELWLGECPCITTIPGNMWRSYLPALKELVIWGCQDIRSIGGAQDIASIQNIYIANCPKLEELNQPFHRAYTNTLSLAHAQSLFEKLLLP